MTAGNSSHHHLKRVYIRERWISLQAPQAVLAEFLLWWELGCLNSIWTPNVKCQNFVSLNNLSYVLNQVTSPSSGERHYHNELSKPVSTRIVFYFENAKKKTHQPYLFSPPGLCVPWKSSIVRTQRLRSTAQKRYSGESRNSYCQDTIIIQPPPTLPLW